MNLKAFDLNLLRVFDAVMSERNMTVAGAKLGLTQPAMSHALRRMRGLCNDPLFVRSTGGMTPTGYAQLLAGPISQAISIIRNALDLDISFDPASSTRTFNLLSTDAAAVHFFPRLMASMEIQAPRIGVVSMQLPRDQYRQALESGIADLAIGQLPEMQKDFHQQLLYDDPLICLMRQDHPSIGRALSMRQFMDAQHVVVCAPAQFDAQVKRALGKRAAKRHIALEVPHFLTVPMVLARTNMVAVFPQRVTDIFAPLVNLKALPLPFAMKAVQVRQFWHERSHHEPGHQWLRRTIASLFFEEGGGAGSTRKHR